MWSVRICMCVYMRVRVGVQAYAYMRSDSLHACVCPCVFAYVCMHMYICEYAHVFIHVHTWTHNSTSHIPPPPLTLRYRSSLPPAQPLPFQTCATKALYSIATGKNSAAPPRVCSSSLPLFWSPLSLPVSLSLPPSPTQSLSMFVCMDVGV